MDNIILRQTLSLVWKLLIAYSIYILLRGHNEPGGGFIGGLLLALGIILRGFLSEATNTQDSPPLAQTFQKAVGLVLLGFIGIMVFPALMGQEVLKGLWTTIWVPIAGKFSSVLLFDIAVYLVVAASSVFAQRAISSSGGRATP